MRDVPPVGVPVCYRHADRETYVRCSRCDRPICPDCMNDAAVGHQCPECVAEGRRTQRPARTAFGAARGAGAAGYATTTLIVVNILMLLLSAASSSRPAQALVGAGFGGFLGGETPLMDRLAVIGQCPLSNGQTVPCGVADGEYYRLLTAMFMHYGVLHLLMNMWALWILGRILESMLGSLRFLAIYLICGLGGNVAAYLFQPSALSAGASTAIFGLFSVLFVALRRLRLSTATVVPIIIINLIFTFMITGISRAGHVGGFVTGALIAIGVAYAPQRNRGPIQVATLLGAVAVLGLLTIWQTGQLTG